MIAFSFLLMLIPISILSTGSSYFFIFSFIGVFYFNSIDFRLKSIELFENCIYLFILFIFFALASLNGADILISFLKFLQFFLLLKLCFYRSFIKVNLNKIRTIFPVYLILCILISPFGFFNMPVSESFRFAGFFFDPNYFAATNFLLLIVLNYFESIHKVKFNMFEFFLISGILLSLSATVISIFLLYKFFIHSIDKKIIGMLSFPFIVFLLVFLPFSSYFVGLALDYLNNFDDISTTLLIYKLASLNQRFEVQTLALQLIFENPLFILFGFGSGRTLELLPRAIHNGFLQLIFAHGIIVYLLFSFFVFKMLSVIKIRYSGQSHALVGFILLLLINNFLDIFFSALIPVFFLLLNYVYSGVVCKNIK
jgi:hypothetical protein